jgi:dTDP-glucose 4,6-dehydratase
VTNILVTGGAGFIGSNFVRLALEETDWRIVVVDKLTYAGSLTRLADVLDATPRVEFVRTDVAHADEMRALLREERPSSVLHLAAESHVDRSIDDARTFLRTNVFGTHALLEASRELLAKHPDPAFRFVQVSTDEVYGSAESWQRFTEPDPYAPSSPYAASKAAADHLARAYFVTHGLPTIITRSSNNYGPWQHPEKFVPTIACSAFAGKPVPVYGDGLQERDWLYVEDHCRGLLATLQRGQPGESYNFGASEIRTNLDAVRGVFDALGDMAHSGELVRVPDRPGHDRRYALDPSKVERAFLWRARTSFEDGIRKTVTWYVQNQAWCREVYPEFGERLGLGARA